jgi:hypothetical protein
MGAAEAGVEEDEEAVEDKVSLIQYTLKTEDK